MSKTILTDANKDFIRKNYLLMSNQDMADVIGCSEAPVSRYKKMESLVVPKNISRGFAIAKMSGKSISTPEQDELLRKLYLTIPVKTLSRQVGLTEGVGRRRLRQLGLVIPEEVIQKRKADTRIKPGNKSWNKGKKQFEYMSAEKIAKTAATRFKKGEKNHNELFDGCIRTRTGHPERNGGRPINYIRISKGQWKELQIYNWEQLHGPVPKGSVLACLNGDTLDCDPGNWKLITRADNAIRNAGHTNLPDVYVAGLLARNGKKVNQEMREELMEYPALLEIKRQQLLLNKEIRNHDKPRN